MAIPGSVDKVLVEVSDGSLSWFLYRKLIFGSLLRERKNNITTAATTTTAKTARIKPTIRPAALPFSPLVTGSPAAKTQKKNMMKFKKIASINKFPFHQQFSHEWYRDVKFYINYLNTVLLVERLCCHLCTN